MMNHEDYVSLCLMALDAAAGEGRLRATRQVWTAQPQE
jgi:hypothetical protein